MIDNRSLVESSLVQEYNCTTGQRQARNSSRLSLCGICGDSARIINYGALSCQACKTFFRRIGFHLQNIHPCLYNGDCNINRETRRFCSSCRFAKCIKAGMSTDFIRKEDERSTRVNCKSTDHTNDLSIKTKRRPSIYGQSHCRRPLLLDDQKRMISNVVRALKISPIIFKVRKIIEDKMVPDRNLPFTMATTVQCISHIYTSIRHFVTCISEFQKLTVDQQYLLLERNLINVINLYSTLIFRQIIVNDNPRLITSFASIYGSEMMLELVSISKKLDIDLTIITLMLVILTFSSNCSMVEYHPELHHDALFTGIIDLLRIQDAYLTVLWKYMICQHGYYKAVITFDELIHFSVRLIKSSAMTYMNNRIYYQLINELRYNTSRFLISNQSEHVHS